MPSAAGRGATAHRNWARNNLQTPQPGSCGQVGRWLAGADSDARAHPCARAPPPPAAAFRDAGSPSRRFRHPGFVSWNTMCTGTFAMRAAVKRLGVLAAALVVHVNGMLMWSPVAQAKIDPLAVIERQIHKANILVVLDTSGSMTGVPGGLFSNSAEVGVDCDDGQNCRGWDQLQCTVSKRDCVRDTDCRKGTCTQTGDGCSTDVDCQNVPRYCKKGQTSCAADTDCNTYACEVGGALCTAGTTCSPLGTCAKTTTTLCGEDANCPLLTAGTCTATGVSCTNSCASVKKCSVTGTSCTTTTDCVKNTTAGTCSKKASRTCKKNSDCGTYGSCVFATNSCTGQDNLCAFKNETCNVDTDNRCLKIADTCLGGTTNKCTAPSLAVSLETCAVPVGVTPLKMCQKAQTICKLDTDCSVVKGDTCGPPTSRAVVAKRVLKNMIEQNYNIANFGLMTFTQGGYYPYFAQGPDAVLQPVTELFSREQLMAAGCYDGATQPKDTCTLNGINYTLRGGTNSQYFVRLDQSATKLAQQNYCGEICASGADTGIYMGSYYQYLAYVGGTPGARSVQTSYLGKNIKIGGKSYAYYDSNPSFYNGGVVPTGTPGFNTTACGSTCGTSCGGRWDDALAPFLDVTSDPDQARKLAFSVSARMQSSSFGGLFTYNTTPSGCALENDGLSAVTATDRRKYSAFNYMNDVITQVASWKAISTTDVKDCWPNYVLFLTDGAANGPGDKYCAVAACSAADPEAAGCTCRSVLAAWHLQKKLGVKTLVIGFSGDVSAGDPAIANDNVAKAGGTDAGKDDKAPYAYTATSESELVKAMQAAIYEAAAGSYSTAPATSAMGLPLEGGGYKTKFVLDARVDYPAWKGHLISYRIPDDATAAPSVEWDAAEEITQMNWWERKVYIGWRGHATPVRILVDPLTKIVLNASVLYGLGLGASITEASDIAHWMLGDPAYSNPSLLGAIINSTPLEVNQPNPPAELYGAKAFADKYKAKNRPSLTYVGSDDGMLHAFFTEDTTVGGTGYGGGSEAFAYVPPDMLKHITQLYVNGGQPADPAKHLFGLANSPKVKDICVSSCADKDNAKWASILTMPEGFGGNKMFALDISSPSNDSGIADPPFSTLWQSEDSYDATKYDAYMGLTMSLPAFFYNLTDTRDDYRVIMTSGYSVDGTKTDQGHRVVVAKATTGAILDSDLVTPPTSCTAPTRSTLVTDIATARDFRKDQQLNMFAAYFGDDWGNLWRYTSNTGAVALHTAFGCSSPLHFAPAVTQLDGNGGAAQVGEIYISQLTNSSLDETTTGLSQPSQIIIQKDLADGAGVVTKKTDFQLKLTAGTDICAVMNDAGGCTYTLPKNARPAASPIAVLRTDAQGFALFSLWYVPATAGCGTGVSYLTVHEIKSDAIKQRYGLEVAKEAVLGTVFVGGNMFVVTSDGLKKVGDGVTNIPVTTNTTGGTSMTLVDRFRQTGWTEFP
jgi:hypothetical protein